MAQRRIIQRFLKGIHRRFPIDKADDPDRVYTLQNARLFVRGQSGHIKRVGGTERLIEYDEAYTNPLNVLAFPVSDLQDSDLFSAPTNFTITFSEAAVAQCSWDAAAGADGYDVYMKSNGSYVKQNSSLITGTSFNIQPEDLVTGYHQVYVTATSGETETDPSNIEDFYFNDFSDYTEGAQPSDWTTRWNVRTWKVFSPPNPLTSIGDFGLLYQQDPDTGTKWRGLSWDVLDAVADAEILFKFTQYDAAADFAIAMAMWRAGGAAGSEDTYLHGLQFGSDLVRLIKRDGGSQSLINGQVPFATTGEIGWYFVRVRLQGSAHKVKVWKDGDPEPASWTIEGTDATFASAGWQGFATSSHNPGFYDFIIVRPL